MMTREKAFEKISQLEDLNREMCDLADWIESNDPEHQTEGIAVETFALTQLLVWIKAVTESGEVRPDTALALTDWVFNRCRANMEEARNMIRSRVQ